MSFDLEIAGTLNNGSCRPLSEGDIVLSYRIGTNRQWKIIEEYSSVGKYSVHSYVLTGPKIYKIYVLKIYDWV